MISTLISEALSPDTIYTLKLRRRGIDLRAGRDVGLMRTIPVAQAMHKEVPVATLTTTAAEAAEVLEQKRERALVVLDDAGALARIVTVQDLERALRDNLPGATLAEIGSQPVRTVFPDEPLSAAVQRLGARDLGQLPVVARADPTQVLGLLRRVDIVRAYSGAVLERLGGAPPHGGPPSLRNLRGTQLVGLTVRRDAPLANRRLRELSLPPEVLVVSVDRAGQTIIPRGESQLLAGDRLLILVQQRAVGTLHEYLAAPRTGRGAASPVSPPLRAQGAPVAARPAQPDKIGSAASPAPVDTVDLGWDRRTRWWRVGHHLAHLPAALLAAAAFLLLAVGPSLLAACTPGGAPVAQAPVTVTPRQLVESTDQFEGRLVRTQGVLRIFEAGTPDEHYAIEDPEQNRIAVRNVPARRLTPLLGAEVQVVGVFRFVDGFGRAIAVEELAPTAGP